MEMGDSMVQKLKALIEEANQALSTGEGCHTESDRRALEDMAVRAGKALSGETVPFSRNRDMSLYFCRRIAGGGGICAGDRERHLYLCRCKNIEGYCVGQGRLVRAVRCNRPELFGCSL